MLISLRRESNSFRDLKVQLSSFNFEANEYVLPKNIDINYQQSEKSLQQEQLKDYSV